MAYFVYILYSDSCDRFYIGSTSDLNQRLVRHNEGKSFSTTPYRPWRLVYSEQFATRSEAMRRERKIKAMKSKSSIKELCSQAAQLAESRSDRD